ncbi:Glucose-repressible alcohol dehydrogenase transcriptional effector [Sporothrix epigloea]|uniref:CCR4-Not complex 3'-5'-exoribonuclease subunit Ccr4 n=1 Tax=Sporothrix epigloea TaxID=1892477 RepID=A0ABP0DEJ6_9PEZI
MYNQGHQQGHATRINGNPTGRGIPMALYNFQQTGGHQHQGLPQHHQVLQGTDQNSHNSGSQGLAHHSSYSGGVLSTASPFSSGLQNGHSVAMRSTQQQPVNEHWADQLRQHKEAEAANIAMVEQNQANYYARLKASENKGIGGPSPILNNSTLADGDSEDIRRPWAVDKPNRQQDWHNLDLSGQGLRALSPQLFCYEFLQELYISSNKLTTLPAAIGSLRQLRILEASHNQISELPPELGMCTFLKQLLLFNNNIRTLPCEIGSLHMLETLGIEGNPLDPELKKEIMDKGTKSLITYLRELRPIPPPPNDRKLVVIQEDVSPSLERVKVFSWNILGERYATSQLYGYTPSGALTWEYRKEKILEEIRNHDADFLSLQEITTDALRETFGPELARDDYKAIHYPRSKARTMSEKDAASVDGCAIFYKGSKYVLLDKQLIDFQALAINRPDMKTQHDIFNRVMPKDNIAIVGFFESRCTGARLIVVNAHLAWEGTLADVKIVQTALIMEFVTKQAERYARWPPLKDKKMIEIPGAEKDPNPPECAPSQEYRSNTDIPLFVCGDYNSTAESGVTELLRLGRLPPDHPEIAKFQYGNFTRDGIEHPFSLRSSYQHLNGTPDELPYTNYTPGFANVIDYIWYSTNSLEIVDLLGPPDAEYLKRVPGFPSYHFPADHLQIMASFVIKPRKDKKGGTTSS